MTASSSSAPMAPSSQRSSFQLNDTSGACPAVDADEEGPMSMQTFRAVQGISAESETIPTHISRAMASARNRFAILLGPILLQAASATHAINNRPEPCLFPAVFLSRQRMQHRRDARKVPIGTSDWRRAD